MRIYRIVLLALAITTLLASGLLARKINPNAYYLWAGFEKEKSWTINDWLNNAFGEPILAGDFVTEGKSSLEIPIKVEKINQQAVIQIFDIGDMRGVERVRFDAYNSTMSEMKVFLMVKTGKNWIYHETARLDIRQGWNKGLEFAIKENIFGVGKYDSAMREPEFVRRFGFIFEAPKGTEGFITIDNIQLKGDETIAAILPPEESKVELKEVVIDDYEAPRIRIAPAADWSCAVNTQQVSDLFTSGAKAVKASFNMTTPGQNAVFMMEDAVDMSDVHEVLVDVYYPFDFPANMTLTLSTGADWAWQEGKLEKIRKGWNRNVTFYLKNKTWKNARTGWRAGQTPDEVNDVRRISFMVIPSEMGEGYVVFDNMRFRTTNEAKLINIKETDMRALRFTPWQSFEKGVNFALDPQSAALAALPADSFGGEVKRGMELKFKTLTPRDRAEYFYTGRIDFAGASGVKFDLYNPTDKVMRISIAFKIGDADEWNESKQVSATPGWNRDIYFDFTTPSFKNAGTNWVTNGYLMKRDDIRSFILKVDPQAALNASVYITDFMVSRKNMLGDAGNYIGFSKKSISGLTLEKTSYLPFESFENGIAGWDGFVETGWGAAVANSSDKYGTDGKKTLQVRYKDTGYKFGAVYVSTSDIDLSQHDSISLDIYNPGRPMKFSIAFKDSLNNDYSWSESPQINLNPGWNRNVRLRFDENIWKNRLNAFTETGSINNMNRINQIILVFFGGTEGSVFVDNIRLGVKEGAYKMTEAYTEHDLRMVITPADFATIELGGRGGLHNEKNNELVFNYLDITLRGFGNELELFGGKNINIFDDPIGLINDHALGVNMMGASISGTLMPINLTYKAVGLTQWGADAWSAGTSVLGALRLKQHLFENSYAGLMYYRDVRGLNDPLTAEFKGDFDQAVDVFGGDGAYNFTIDNVLKGGVTAEALYAMYASNTPAYFIDGRFSSEEITDEDSVMLLYAAANAKLGDFAIDGYYRNIGGKFPAIYLNPDFKAGTEAKMLTMSYLMDDLWPFAQVKAISGEWARWVNHTRLMLQLDLMDSFVDSYERQTVIVSLQNDQSLALANYVLYFKYNREGNGEDAAANQVDTIIPTYTINADTKILLGNAVSLGFMARYERTQEFADTDSLTYTPHAKRDINRYTGFLELVYKLTNEIRLTGSYKLLTTDHESRHNLFAKFEADLFGKITFSAAYGLQPFTGYWKDNYSDNTRDIVSLTLKGRF